MGARVVGVMTTHAKVPHLALPFRVERNGKVAVLEQDTLDEIAQSVLVLLLTHRGQRLEVPDYGIQDLVFDSDIDYSAITAAIFEWEPRASAIIDDDISPLDDMIRTIRARVSAGEA